MRRNHPWSTLSGENLMKKQEKKHSQLEITIQALKKKYGDETIGKVTSLKDVEMTRLSSGSPFLDWAIGGGWPLGRTVELYGPYSSGKSLIALRTIASAQKENRACVYIDAERAFDPDFAAVLGVDLDKLILVREAEGEKVFNIIDKLLEGDVSIIAVDSVASLVPLFEEESPLEQQTVALQARLMSKALRKLTGRIGKSNTLVIFVNQIREKVGCFQYYTRVVLEDGSTEKIGYLVNNKINSNVLTYNEKTGGVEPCPITGWFKNGTTDKFLHFRFRKPQGRGRGEFSCTPEHQVMVGKGKYKQAKKIAVGDKILTIINDWHPSEIQKEIVTGGLLGDGYLRRVGKSKFQYRETHCKEQDNYLRWKSSYFDHKTTGRHSGGGLYFETYLTTYFEHQHIGFYSGGKKVKIPEDIKLTPLILAIWYQDDGYLANKDKKAINLCTNSFQPESIRNLRSALVEQFGIETGTKTRKAKKGQIELTLGRKETKKFFEVCKQFIHPSMYYKLPNCGLDMSFTSPDKEFEIKKLISRYAYVTHKYIKPKTKSMVKFDIETKNHNYLADGAVVHNSYGNPEITSGGRALGFYSSVRVEVRRGDWIQENKKKIGQVVKFRVTKSKICPAWREGYFKYLYGGTIDDVDELVSMLILSGKASRRGAWYYIGEDKFNGREELENRIREDSKFKEELLKL